jgi:hypothetical protein
MFRLRLGGALRALAVVLTLVLASGSVALAQVGGAVLSGTVTANDQPVTGAAVTASGSNVVLHATTDARGSFSIPAAPIGTYDMNVVAPQGKAALRVVSILIVSI